MTKLKWNTLTWNILCRDCYVPCERRKLFHHWFTVHVCVCVCVCVCVSVCVCVCVWDRERDIECFPIKWDLVIAPDPLGICHLQWVKLHRSWKYHFGDHSNPRNVLYILTREAYDFRLLERHDIYPIFLCFLPLYKRVFQNVSRNDSNTQLTRHLQITSWSKIQDKLLHTKSRIM